MSIYSEQVIMGYLKKINNQIYIVIALLGTIAGLFISLLSK